MKKIHIIGGGSFSYVRNHLALAAPAFGETARRLATMFNSTIQGQLDQSENPTNASDQVQLHLTKMADHTSKLVTNEDVAAKLEELKADPETRVIILNAALCDYEGSILERDPNYPGIKVQMIKTPSGSHAKRLKTAEGEKTLVLTPAAKLIGTIRKDRKDIFLVGFKTTTGATSDEQYKIALNMLKEGSINLVLANDTVTRNNMIVTPEESRYFETTDRDVVLKGLVEMVLARSSNTFTRSSVVPGETVPWQSNMIPDNLRQVVDHCIARGAYKPFRGVTAGHFAVKLDEGRILTSKRKHDYNKLSEDGLVLVEYDGDDKVIAHGFKPSVGGQSQRAVFAEHPEATNIVHFHCPVKPDARDAISVASQMEFECGSHNCGSNTSSHLRGHGKLKAVMLDNHGPNIVFSRETPAAEVIEFIEANFDLDRKTGGMLS